MQSRKDFHYKWQQLCQRFDRAADLGNTVLFPPLCTEGTLHLISEDRATNPDALADYCRRHGIDCLKIVPSHLSALLSAAKSRGSSAATPVATRRRSGFLEFD